MLSTSNSANADALWQTLAAERPFLLRLARLQLGSQADAEDAVQETLLGAAKGWRSFEGRSMLRSWLTGILRNKIIDAIRGRRFTAALPDQAAGDDDGRAEFDALFTADDAWHPAVFIDTVCGATKAAERQLLDIVELCMDRLPRESSRLFLMREYLGMELAEIEEHSTVSAGNLRVILYRARMRLRECAVRGWGELE
jgi:RNA polymerase sigma-70 factor (ECF subfamily)